jgi:excisionase family DNA binding protein
MALEELIREIVREEIAKHLTAEDPWLDANQAAAYMGVTRQRIYDLVAAWRLPRYGEKGTALRLRRSDLDAFMSGTAPPRHQERNVPDAPAK